MFDSCRKAVEDLSEFGTHLRALPQNNRASVQRRLLCGKRVDEGCNKHPKESSITLRELRWIRRGVEAHQPAIPIDSHHVVNVEQPPDCPPERLLLRTRRRYS